MREKPERKGHYGAIEIIQLSRLRLLDDLPRFVESLQGEQGVGEVAHMDRLDPGLGAGFRDLPPRPSPTDPVRCTRCPG